MLRFDHIAIGCAPLEQGAAYMAAHTGLKVPVGGEHPLMGTHNLVMALGDDTFFEVIAINPTAPAPSRSRWFGLDDTGFSTPRPLSWVLNSNNLEADLDIAKSLGVDLGVPTIQTRGDMSWRFAVRDDGAIPLKGAAPMIMEWPKSSTHPAACMPDLGVRLKSVELETPYAEILDNFLTKLGAGPMPVRISKASETRLTMTLSLNSGREVILHQ